MERYSGQLSQPVTVIYKDHKGNDEALTFDSFADIIAVVKSLSEQGRPCEIHQGNNIYTNSDWLTVKED